MTLTRSPQLFLRSLRQCGLPPALLPLLKLLCRARRRQACRRQGRVGRLQGGCRRRGQPRGPRSTPSAAQTLFACLLALSVQHSPGCAPCPPAPCLTLGALHGGPGLVLHRLRRARQGQWVLEISSSAKAASLTCTATICCTRRSIRPSPTCTAPVTESRAEASIPEERSRASVAVPSVMGREGGQQLRRGLSCRIQVCI